MPAAVRALIERCWKGLPELRPSMAEVVAELQRIQAEQLLGEPHMSSVSLVLGALPGTVLIPSNPGQQLQLQPEAGRAVGWPVALMTC